MTMKTFHIRAPLPRKKGGNQFYRANDARVRKTLCGQPITSHDIKYSWQADGVGRFEPCQECIEIRRAAKAKRSPAPSEAL